jgi:hypothetical protein
MDRGKVPEQFAVILQLEQSGDLSLYQLRQLIEARICALPRLRQRLINVPPGFGRPVWVDDHDFRIERHVRAVQCSDPGDERALFDVALSVIMEPLPRKAPLWSVVLITDLADCGAAVVVVLHHVLADGLGGLNVLATLVDPGAPPADVPFLGLSRCCRTWLGMRGSHGLAVFDGRPARGSCSAGPCSQVAASIRYL